MECPACREPLIVLELDQVELDHCVSCKGIWLDHGELNLILEDAPDKDTVFSSFALAPHSKEKRRKCPICLRNMEKVLCGAEGNVNIDRCPRGDGLWFDVGELNEMIQVGSWGASPKVLDLLKDMFGKTLGSKQGGV